ncbi:hypothetical protein FKW77_002428 [Venturia effusa]|uniref:Uncharacterized protein n=1 Tax=Venturia effusa TaxID=50376 RepID=A0A517L6U7_9PEZI|nr:hypothetical protein FKW77_002428 [Venturia effusa]
MKLRCSRTLKEREIFGEDIGREEYEYAILSHTWGEAGAEVTYQDIELGLASGDTSHYTQKAGWDKLRMFCAKAEQNGIRWVWADTCCIDKTNNVELSEAINSMWTWYAKCKECYAHLADLENGTAICGISEETSPTQRQAFKASNYFKRAWTLQELLAPRKLRFYSRDWQEIGDRILWASAITEATGIPRKALEQQECSLNDFSVAQRMSWAAYRESTRPEDIAYSLFGIFDINMDLRYGEGVKKAFLRLQEEIMKGSGDRSLFAWEPEIPVGQEHITSLVGPFAHHPRQFRNARNIRWQRVQRRPESSMTGTTGLRITVPIMQLSNSDDIVALLDCYQVPEDGDDYSEGVRLGIRVKEKDIHDEGDRFDRISALLARDTDNSWGKSKQKIRTICLSKEIIIPNADFVHPSRIKAFDIRIRHPRSFETKKTIFNAPDSTTYNPFDGPTWHDVCLLKETKSPHWPGREQNFWLIMGYDHVEDKAWCEIQLQGEEDIHKIWSEVREGPGSTKAKLRRRLRKHLAVCISMEERVETTNRAVTRDVLDGEEVSHQRFLADGGEMNSNAVEMKNLRTDDRTATPSSRRKEAKSTVIVVVRARYWWFESLDRKLQAVVAKVESAIKLVLDKVLGGLNHWTRKLQAVVAKVESAVKLFLELFFDKVPCVRYFFLKRSP